VRRGPGTRDPGPECGRPAVRGGVTLVELLVAVVIVGLLAGVAGLAVRRAPEPSDDDRLVAAIAAARRTALREGRQETIELRLDGEPHAVTALPDGSVITDEATHGRLGIDRLTGTVMSYAR
jgi:prepilin-type N-terminal cleavage/methylation domain-containing protein